MTELQEQTKREIFRFIETLGNYSDEEKQAIYMMGLGMMDSSDLLIAKLWPNMNEARESFVIHTQTNAAKAFAFMCELFERKELSRNSN